MATFEEFYKAVKQLLDEDPEATEEQKAAIHKGIEGAKPYIDIINKKDEELGLTKEESYVLSYLMEENLKRELFSGDMPNWDNSDPGTHKTGAYDVTIMQLVSMMFVHDHKEAVIALYNSEAARLDFLKSLTAKDMKDVKLDRSDEKVAALLKNEAPTFDDLLEVIGFGNVAFLYERHNKYRTRAKAKEAGAITEAPSSLAIPTLPKYQYSMSLYQAGGAAYLQPLSSTDGLKFKGGKMYFDGARMKEVSEVELQNMKTKDGIQSIDLQVLRTFYSIILTQFEASGFKTLEDVLTISVPTLAEFIGLQSNLNKKDIQQIIAKTQSYHNIIGVLHGTRNGRPVQSLYPVLNFEGYNDKTNTIRFSSPYMNYVIKTVYNLSLRKTKDGKQKLKKNGDPLRIATHSYLIDSSIAKERNKAAVENVVIIVTLIEQAGDNIPRIKASTLIERNVQLAERLEAAKNPRSLLKTTFTKTWELLRTKTRLTEAYKNIQLPEPGDPAYMPTMSTLDKVVFTFPHEGKR